MGHLLLPRALGWKSKSWRSVQGLWDAGLMGSGLAMHHMLAPDVDAVSGTRHACTVPVPRTCTKGPKGMALDLMVYLLVTI